MTWNKPVIFGTLSQILQDTRQELFKSHTAGTVSGNVGQNAQSWLTL